MRKLLASIAIFALCGLSVFSYFSGVRKGRGQACFEVGVSIADQNGESLRSALMSRPGARWEYSFWGNQCTVSIGWEQEGHLVGGRWRFDLPTATLYSETEESEVLFPAAGRWQPPER